MLGLAPAAGNASQRDSQGQPAPQDADAIASRIRTIESQPASSLRAEALQAVADDAGALAAREPTGSAMWRRLQSDRLYALGLARRDDAALQVYGEMEAAGSGIPDYVVPSLTSALARLKHINQAGALLRQLSQSRPTDPEPAIRRAYVFADAGRQSDAHTALQQWLDGADTGQRATESDRLRAELALVRIDRWNGAHEEAARHLQRLAVQHGQAPEWRMEAAAVARAQGRPRAALALLDGMDATIAADTRAHAWADLDRPALAQAYLGPETDPDLRARVESLAGSRGSVEMAYRNSRSAALASPNGADELAFTATMDSRLLHSGWRLGATVASHRADFRGDRPEVKRAGFRLVRSGTGGESSIEVGRSFDHFLPRTYAIARADYWVADGLRLAARVSIHDPESSLQARASSIGSNALDVAATWRPDARYRFDAGSGVVHFDDGNRRNWASLSGERKLPSRPGTTTSAFAGLYASRNSLDDAPYFNPRHDTSLELGIVHGFRGGAGTWHSLRPSVSVYREAGWHAFVIPQLSYSLRYPTGNGHWLQAGLSYARPVYDGRRETHFGLTLEYAWGQQ